MRDYAVENTVLEIHIPRLGAGLDRLNWNVTKQMVLEVFRNQPIRITVYTPSKVSLQKATNKVKFNDPSEISAVSSDNKSTVPSRTLHSDEQALTDGLQKGLAGRKTSLCQSQRKGADRPDIALSSGESKSRNGLTSYLDDGPSDTDPKRHYQGSLQPSEATQVAPENSVNGAHIRAHSTGAHSTATHPTEHPVGEVARPAVAHPVKRNSSGERPNQENTRRYPVRKRTRNNQYLNDFVKKLQHPENHVIEILAKHSQISVKQNGGSSPNSLDSAVAIMLPLPTQTHPENWSELSSSTEPDASDTKSRNVMAHGSPPEVNKADINEARNGVVPTTLKVYSWFDEGKPRPTRPGLTEQQVKTLVEAGKVATNRTNLHEPDIPLEDLLNGPYFGDDRNLALTSDRLLKIFQERPSARVEVGAA